MSDNWLTNSYKNMWLPYTQMKNSPYPLKVSSVEGCYIILDDGSHILDSISSWWSVCHGYRHPIIMDNIIKQVKKLPHVMFSGLAHEAGYTLASQLVKILPNGLSKVFFSDSGSVAIEVAMKIAVQYHCNMQNYEKNKFIYFNNSYHGDTTGCMSISDAIHNKSFVESKQYMINLPSSEHELALFSSQIKDLSNQVAAVVIEPLLQAAGGMKIHSSNMLKAIYKVIVENDILFIADEVATGFGRTGSMFACNQAELTPDIMVIGKALTGGFCGLAATITTDRIFSAFLSDDKSKALMHGPTFMANPIACAAANASVNLFSTEPRLQQILDIENQFRSELERFRTLKCVKNIRVKGAVGVIELYNDINIQNLVYKAKDKGVWIRPIDNIIYFMPPFIITQSEISFLVEVIFNLLREIA